MIRIPFVDSHTGGEPTRVVIGGAPDLGRGSMAERLTAFRDRHDTFRSAVVNEPRGNDVVVGALLCEPVDPASAAGVIFFNNVGYLGMCGHGAIGVVATLAQLGRIAPGAHRLETPVGTVTATLADDGAVTIENVPSYRAATGVSVEVAGQTVTGDLAWGGNWFFLCEDHGQPLTLDRVDALTGFTWAVRAELARRGITGDTGAEIDHIELFGPPTAAHAHSRNFVLCPGKAYDRSPCGTGTSAKVACLAAAGKLAEGEPWVQESIVGSLFEASYRRAGGEVVPSIRGRAWICAEGNLLLDPTDPFHDGIRK
ncbi:MAG: proline racemase family protein [Bryobacteraceae bacterium]